MAFLDIITFASYVALTTDILFQIHRVYINKSSHDVSIVGLGIRYAAILIILYKFWTVGDLPLILGQILVALTFSLYLCLAILYYKK